MYRGDWEVSAARAKARFYADLARWEKSFLGEGRSVQSPAIHEIPRRWAPGCAEVGFLLPGLSQATIPRPGVFSACLERTADAALLAKGFLSALTVSSDELFRETAVRDKVKIKISHFVEQRANSAEASSVAAAG